MKIEHVQLRVVQLRLHEPFRISSGQSFHRRILLVRIAGEGTEGWGECVAEDTPHYAYETVETALHVLDRWLVPAVLGTRFASAAELAGHLERAIRGHSMAKAALEMAAWDMEARQRGVSLATLLGGVRDAVPSGVSIGIQDDVGQLLDRIERFAAEGYRRIKIKVAPGWDVDVVEAVRKRFPEIPLMVDANCAYTLDDAERLTALDPFSLLMVEQPLGADDLLDHAALQARLATPLCLDESITSPARCAEALHLRSGRIVNIKPGRVGGHTASIRIHDLCADAGVPVWCGGMLESGIGRAHNVALASLPNFRLPGDTSASRRYWARDVVEPEFVLRPDGTVPVPQAHGIGVQVDEAFLSSIQEAASEYTAPPGP